MLKSFHLFPLVKCTKVCGYVLPNVRTVVNRQAALWLFKKLVPKKLLRKLCATKQTLRLQDNPGIKTLMIAKRDVREPKIDVFVMRLWGIYK